MIIQLASFNSIICKSSNISNESPTTWIIALVWCSTFGLHSIITWHWVWMCTKLHNLTQYVMNNVWSIESSLQCHGTYNHSSLPSWLILICSWGVFSCSTCGSALALLFASPIAWLGILRWDDPMCRTWSIWHALASLLNSSTWASLHWDNHL